MAANPIEATAPATEVTVLEDRAHVVRVGRVTVPAGSSLLSVTGVAPVVSDKTVIATLSGPGAAHVRALRVTRKRLIIEAEQPAAIVALNAELRPLERERQRGSEEQRLISVEIDQLAQVLSNTLTEIGEDASWAKDAAAEWRASLDRIAERERALRLRAVELDAAMDDLGRRIADLHERIAVASQGSSRVVAAVVCEIDAAAAGEYELRLAYIVPGACWRPYHTARLIEDGKTRIDFSSDACVWQNSGEDWTGVTLRCSTERSSLGLKPPTLTSDVLSLRRKEAGITVEVREQTVQTTGGAAGAPSFEVMGIDDGGETRLLTCPGTASVPSDGMPHRVALFQFSTPAEAVSVVIGELVPAVILRTSQANAATVPLLAGPVDLIRRGGLAGRGSILYIAPGARFDLGWGPDGDVRVFRQQYTQDEKPGALSNWSSTLHHTAVMLSNLSGAPREILVTERVPVSSLDQVKIELDADTKPTAKADDHGMLRWTVALPARGHLAVTLRYRLRKRSDVAGV